MGFPCTLYMNPLEFSSPILNVLQKRRNFTMACKHSIQTPIYDYNEALFQGIHFCSKVLWSRILRHREKALTDTHTR